MQILIIGLGNPGVSYENTRHNVGFIALDLLARKYNSTLNFQKKFNSETLILTLEDKKLILAKPQNYMNLSGASVSSIKNFYKIDVNNIFVIHDDIDLELGRIKIKQGGSSAGHNGVKSIDSHIGPNYFRIRVGIGKSKYEDVSSFVLGKFQKEEYDIITPAINKLIDNLDYVITNKAIKNYH